MSFRPMLVNMSNMSTSTKSPGIYKDTATKISKF